MSGTTEERYLTLGLQLGRHVDGIVDSYFGPPELAAAVDAAPAPDPRALVAEADALLDEVDDGWLRDQLDGVRAFAGVLAGEEIAYADEVERCYGVRPEFTDEAVFEAAHAELETLLPGDGPLADRYETWRKASDVPGGRVEAVVGGAIDAARRWMSGQLRLPEGEEVVLEIVRDKPWAGYCTYLGGYRSTISVNVELPLAALELLFLALHETYAGHHAERCLKERHLVRDLGLLEETIVLLPTPQSLIAEGIATALPERVLDESGLELAAGVGIEFDLAQAREIARVRQPLGWAVVNAALLLYDSGESVGVVQDYIARWTLATPQRAAHQVRFLQDPTSRSYVLTYAAGRDLCEAYVDGDPARLQRLLTEQVRVGELQANVRS